ncbi:lipid-transfer protein [Sporichthya brevicatena]|uniref:propanoyl-CoA C-acyltransferase n=2 Tax=Sporichthya brevicatena TaxID=171442 RepID=A0ABP3RK90_9ACTN
MIPFAKPGASDPYDVMGEAAARAALTDSGLDYSKIQQAYVGYVYGDSTSGQAALYGLGLSGVPIVNVNNNCSTGSSALWLARQAVASGTAECVIALGFEQMQRGALTAVFDDRPDAMGRLNAAMGSLQQRTDAPAAAQMFGGAGAEYAQRYGVDPALFAKISVKARRHAANNPYAVFRDLVTEDEVLNSPHIYGPLTRLQCCPPTCGAAAAVVCSAEFAARHSVSKPVRIRAQAMTTDVAGTFDDGTSMMTLVGFEMARRAANEVYEASGVDPQDLRVVELHDCFSTNEVLSYESLGLVEEGGAEKFVLAGDNTYGGRVVTNPSGGLLSKGHPLGATGLAQCTELVWQLRGEAGARQVEGDLPLALQHNLGLGGACVVTLYERAAR